MWQLPKQVYRRFSAMLLYTVTNMYGVPRIVFLIEAAVAVCSGPCVEFPRDKDAVVADAIELTRVLHHVLDYT